MLRFLSAGLRCLCPRGKDPRDLGPDGRPQPGTCVPSRTRRISAIVAGGDVIEITGGVARLIEQRIHKANWLSHALVDQRGQSSPQWSDGAGTANHIGLFVDEE